MKKKWYAILNKIKFSLILLLVGCLLVGLGSINVENSILSDVLFACYYVGSFIKKIAPLMIAINYVGDKKESGIVVIATIICYIVINICSIYFAFGQYTNDCYLDIFDLAISTVSENGSIIAHQPLNFGLIGTGILILIIEWSYKISRKRYNYGFLSFIDNDAWLFFVAIALSVIASLVMCFAYDVVVNQLIILLGKISRNSANPAVMFAYGILDKLTSIFQVHNFISNNFWYGALGGSWIAADETLILGDANIWIGQMLTSEIGKTTGRFLSGTYIGNIFVIPAITIAYWFNTTNKIDKGRLFGLLIGGLLASLLCGSTLPMEYVLLFTAPMLLVVYLIIIGLSYMVLAMLNINIGFSTIGDIAGNLIDLVKYYGIIDLHQPIIILLIVGIVAALLSVVTTLLYYRYFAQDFLDDDTRKKEMRLIIKGLGGEKNIKMITSSPINIIVVLNENDDISVESLLLTRAHLVTEKYFGYVIEYGPGAYRLCQDIKKEIKDYNDCLAYHRDR